MGRARSFKLCRPTVLTIISVQSMVFLFLTCLCHPVCEEAAVTTNGLWEQGATELRIDELEGRLVAINDKLSGVVKSVHQ